MLLSPLQGSISPYNSFFCGGGGGGVRRGKRGCSVPGREAKIPHDSRPEKPKLTQTETVL